MKVIKKGRPQKGWAKEYGCSGNGNGGGGCGARLLVEEGDLFKTTSSCMGETDTHITFKCPECKVLTDIPERDVPTHVYVGLKVKNPRSSRSTFSGGRD